MSSILISILGNTDYYDVNYQYYDSNFLTQYGVIAIADLCLVKGELITTDDLKVYIFGTKESKQKHYNTLCDQFLKHFDIDINFIQIPTNLDLGNSWETFNIIKSNINITENDQLYIDITNGFRSQPFIMLMTVNYLESLYSNNYVNKVFYCKYDTNSPEIVDLTSMYFLTKWSNTIDTFIHTGQYSGFDSLFSKLNDKSELYRKLNNISKAINKLSRALKLVKVGFYDFISNDNYDYKECVSYCVYNLHKEIYHFKKSNDAISNEFLILKDLFTKIEEEFNWVEYNDKLTEEEVRKMLINSYYIHIYKILKYYRKTGMIQQGLTVINEILFISDYEKYNTDIKSKGLNYLYNFWKTVDYHLNNESNSKYRNLKQKLIKLNRYRNSINHSFYLSFSKGNIRNNIRIKIDDIINAFDNFINDLTFKQYSYLLNTIHVQVYYKEIKILSIIHQ